MVAADRQERSSLSLAQLPGAFFRKRCLRHMPWRRLNSSVKQPPNKRKQFTSLGFQRSRKDQKVWVVGDLGWSYSGAFALRCLLSEFGVLLGYPLLNLLNQLVREVSESALQLDILLDWF